MLVICGIALVCALTAAADVTTQQTMDVTQLLQQLQTDIQEFRGINIDGLTKKPSTLYSTTPLLNMIQSNIYMYYFRYRVCIYTFCKRAHHPLFN